MTFLRSPGSFTQSNELGGSIDGDGRGGYRHHQRWSARRCHLPQWFRRWRSSRASGRRPLSPRGARIPLLDRCQPHSQPSRSRRGQRWGGQRKLVCAAAILHALSMRRPTPPIMPIQIRLWYSAPARTASFAAIVTHGAVAPCSESRGRMAFGWTQLPRRERRAKSRTWRPPSPLLRGGKGELPEFVRRGRRRACPVHGPCFVRRRRRVWNRRRRGRQERA